MSLQEGLSWTRVHPRFFDQVRHETMYASSGNKYFSLNHDIIRLTKIMNNLLEHLKICTFKFISTPLFIIIFKSKMSISRLQILIHLLKVFQLMCTRCIHGFMSNLIKKILDGLKCGRALNIFIDFMNRRNDRSSKIKHEQ